MTAAGALVVEPDGRRLGVVRRYLRDHPRLVDAAVAAFYVLNVVLAAPDPYHPLSAPVAASLAAAGAGALLLRRSRPTWVVAAFVVMAGASLVSVGQLGGTELGIALALYALAVARPPTQTWWTAAAAVAAATVVVWLWQDDSLEELVTGDGTSIALVDERITNTFGIATLALVGVALGISVRLRRERMADLVERAAALERDRDRQAQVARAEERARIAREVHDVVAHSVSVMVRLADGASVALDRQPDQARVALDELSRTGRAALSDMRRVLGAVTEGDVPLGPAGEGRDLREVVDGFRAAGLQVRAEGLGLDLPDNTGVRLAIYRVIQESLTNVLRHAPGTAGVSVVIRQEPTRWIVDVVDQGAREPVTESEGAGMGLIGMRERVALLGGTVEAGPSGHGWRVTAELPVEEAP
ncbi:sensor histidine kinase [Demequina muriae]|uniref:histidine kinase n=1 Tax=Demequina muriae TaxID=3051664 RepID=A0ABT8GGR0_9MICO|nr:histidine kinase [Demequina sp. EGI L300058]MDN4480617.1 histidine kinase [Demequina sp. EGI L300058]